MHVMLSGAFIVQVGHVAYMQEVECSAHAAIR